MAIIDTQCGTCGFQAETYRHASDWPKTPLCEKCGEATVQIHLPKAIRWSPNPVVVFEAPDGTPRFPGDPAGLSAANYEKLGYKRVEIRGAQEMRSFERKMSKQQYSEMARRVEAKQEQDERRQKESRSELRRRMQHFSPLGRDVALRAMARNDAKPKAKVHDAGFHSEIYSMDRSNRQESRDAQGRRRRD